MSFHTEFITYLKDNATIAAAIPGGIFHEFYPQQKRTYPIVIVQMISNNEIEFDQDYPAGDKMNQRRYQLDVVGLDIGQVIDGVETVDAELISFAGSIGSFVIQRIERTGQRDLSTLDGDKKRRRISSDYIITY